MDICLVYTDIIPHLSSPIDEPRGPVSTICYLRWALLDINQGGYINLRVVSGLFSDLLDIMM